MQTTPIVKNALTLSAAEITSVTQLARRLTGIELGSDKSDFIQSRLQGHVTELGCQTFKEYCELLSKPSSQSAQEVFCDLVTTHTTQFFREQNHFDWMANGGVQMLMDDGIGRSDEMIVWSAACSTGQELYSVIMALDQIMNRAERPIRFRGIGSDLSPNVLHKARNAVYSKFEIAGIPEELRHQYLLSSKKSDDLFRIGPAVRERTTWRLGNLVFPETLDGLSADIVLLRNVLIYFDEPTQKKIVDTVLSKLNHGGILMTGHTETNVPSLRSLKVIAPTIYQKAK